MTKDQQKKKLTEEIETLKEAHKESKERLMELYVKEKSKREVEQCIFLIFSRASAYTLDSIVEGRKPNANEFFKREAEKVK